MPIATTMETLRFVRERIEAILHAPGMWTWGPPAALELQVLQLLEVAHTAAGSTAEVAAATPDRYWEHIGASVPASSLSLAQGLGLKDDASDQFISILRAFVAKEWERMRAGGFPEVGSMKPVLQDASGLSHYEH